MINKIKDYLNTHPQDFAQYILPQINGIPTIDDVKYDSSYADYDGMWDALSDAEIIDYDNDDYDDIHNMFKEAVSNFYNNFKFVSIEIVDVFESIYEIKYTFKETEYSIVGIIDGEYFEFTPIENCDWGILAKFLHKTKRLENK